MRHIIILEEAWWDGGPLLRRHGVMTYGYYFGDEELKFERLEHAGGHVGGSWTTGYGPPVW